MIDIIKKFLFARFRSLKFSMFYTFFIGLALAVGVFFALESLANGYIENKYLADEAKVERERGYLEELQEYVDTNNLTSTDVDALSSWVRDKGYVYVMIYKDDQLVLDSDTVSKPQEPDENESPEDDNSEENDSDGSDYVITFPDKEELIEYAKQNGTYPIEMTDGVPLLVAMVDYTEYFYYGLLRIISLTVAAVVLMIVMMIYSSRVTSRITRLARKVNTVASGETEFMITSNRKNGRDEITDLADNVENMRCAMLANIAKEREAINSNTELITSISHDIRTPLTILLGYMDIMKQHTNDENMQEYLAASERCALRLKSMSDDMFNYFLVFGGDASECDFENYDAATLFEQILSEKILLLHEKGYTVDIPMLDNMREKLGGISVVTDAPKLMRIAENVFSNITKYADKSYPVVIQSQLLEDKIIVEIVNKTLQNSNKAESNGIGLRTCNKLAEMLGIGFESEKNEDLYKVTIIFTVKEKKADE